jgi:ubiquinone/menaquinone biosynthesis C-methylase UbiE
MSVNRGQAEAWNGGESVHYVDHADRYDRQLRPFVDAIFDQLDVEPHHGVLDVGCGCGVTTLRAARIASSATGVDISAPLISVATTRAREEGFANVEFVVGDAQIHPFPDEAYDHVISQFGLMFFDDPVGAFTNVARALRPGGGIGFVTWQGLEANEWIRIVADAVAQHVERPVLGGLSAGPGMFALDQPGEISAVLHDAGFTEAAIEPLTSDIVIAGGGTLDESLDFLFGMGIVRGLLGRLDADAREQAVDVIGNACRARYVEGAGVTFGAAGWQVTARRN